MTPDGDLAMEFTRHDYSIDTHTLWFDTRRQRDAEPAGGVGGPVDGGGEPGVYTQNRVPIPSVTTTSASPSPQSPSTSPQTPSVTTTAVTQLPPNMRALRLLLIL